MLRVKQSAQSKQAILSYNVNFIQIFLCFSFGAQWLSGRVLDSRPRGRGFEPHRRHCVVVLEQDTFILAWYLGRPVPV